MSTIKAGSRVTIRPTDPSTYPDGWARTLEGVRGFVERIDDGAVAVVRLLAPIPKRIPNEITGMVIPLTDLVAS
jgi:hypothetical protein